MRNLRLKKLDLVVIIVSNSGAAYSTNMTTTCPYQGPSYTIKLPDSYIVNDIYISSVFLNDYFYNKKEERNIKLKKLQKIKIEI